MHGLLYWGAHLNWTPIAWLGVATVPLFAARLLTVWIYIRRLRKAVGDAPDEHDEATLAKAKALFSSQKPVVRVSVSSFYFLVGLAFIGTALWGLVSAAWWMILLGALVWLIVHWPFREVMLSWAQFQNTRLVMQDADALLKGDLSPEQAKAIKKRLGICDTSSEISFLDFRFCFA